SKYLSNKQLAYFIYFTDARDEEWFEKSIHNQNYEKNYRSFFFRGNTADIITFLYQPPGCLKILDRKYSNSITNPNLSFRQVKEISFSSLDRIQEYPQNYPFEPLFGEQAENSWCYYFEKADLARQFGKYAEIVRLGDEAISAGQTPRVASEWLPFLEGYLWNAKWEKAEWIIIEIQNAKGNYNDGLCYTLKRVKNNQIYPYKTEISNLISAYNCSWR
ncbi:MAG: hypothetical protein J7L66_04410, partial [Anaerolineaceae bacterium]|nr:hypothetical protein [Anaerolineaceae bacterium]